jgi:hypothetical protein
MEGGADLHRSPKKPLFRIQVRPLQFARPRRIVRLTEMGVGIMDTL